MRVVAQLDEHRAVPAVAALPSVSLGFIRDLTELLQVQPIRPAIGRERCHVPLIIDQAAGKVAYLDLELVADGRGEMYVHPELAFVYRDELFVAGEQAAWEHVKCLLAESARDVIRHRSPDLAESPKREASPSDAEDALNLDVRWRLFRRNALDGQESPFTRLTGDSASGAFGLGTLKLLAG